MQGKQQPQPALGSSCPGDRRQVTEAGDERGRDTYQSRLKLQGDGPQGVFELLLFCDVHDHHLGGLAQLPDIPPHDLRGAGVGGTALRPEVL